MPVNDEPSAEDALPSHALEACLLLLLAEEPDHGYSLVARLRGLGLESTSSSSVYRMLRSLDNGGLIQSAWVAGDSTRPRRSYRLTEDGMATLRDLRSANERILEFFGTLDESLARLDWR